MTAATRVKGWCPSLLAPMVSGDGLLVRVKPSAATLTLAQAQSLAQAALRDGNGMIELTNRANLQIRGLSPETVDAFAAAMQAEGLAANDGPFEQIRNVLASPLGPEDLSATFNSHALAGELEAALAQSPELHRLPPKFGVLIDGGGALSLAGHEADIMLRAHSGGLGLWIGGSDLAAHVQPGSAVEAALALALAFLTLGSSRTPPPRRMRDLVSQMGSAAIFAKAGLAASPRTPPVAPAARPMSGPGWLSLGLPFGQIEAPRLLSLIGKARALGAEAFHCTPWRAFVVSGLAEAAIEDLQHWARSAGLIISPDDPRLTIAACPGYPHCASGRTQSRADAERLARSGLASGTSLHVSGCEKGCAQPKAAHFTLVGESEERYSLVRNGRAGDTPVATGLSLDAAITELRKGRSNAPRL